LTNSYSDEPGQLIQKSTVLPILQLWIQDISWPLEYLDDLEKVIVVVKYLSCVGLTSSLHYYYLAFIVLTYLAYLIAVNISYRSSLGTTDPGIQALIALDWLFGESEKHSPNFDSSHQ
jgi:hypothetical protein